VVCRHLSVRQGEATALVQGAQPPAWPPCAAMRCAALWWPVTAAHSAPSQLAACQLFQATVPGALFQHSGSTACSSTTSNSSRLVAAAPLCDHKRTKRTALKWSMMTPTPGDSQRTPRLSRSVQTLPLAFQHIPVPISAANPAVESCILSPAWGRLERLLLVM
jgi:hypothetical protein